MAMTLAQARAAIGHKVRYHPPIAGATDRTEVGVISSVNDRYVFVAYGRGGTQATRPEDLELM